MRASSSASTASAAAAIRGGESENSRSRTVDSSRMLPMNCRITPSPPERDTVPSCASSSPEMMRVRVVLPDPFAPTSATTAPSPTRNEMSVSSGRPSGRSKQTPDNST